MNDDRIPNNVTHISTAERGLGRPGTLRAPYQPRPEYRPPVEGAAPKKKFEAKGHDRQLQEAQFGKNRVRITTVAGERFYGTITRRDKFTVTLLHEHKAGVEHSGLEEIFYKHAIEGVLVFLNDAQRDAA